MSSSQTVQMKITIPGGSGKDAASGPASLGTRLPAQNYEKIRRQCMADNTLFEDPYFPADDSSLFFSQKLPFKPEWKRPGEICSQPKLYTGGASRFDVQQGILGDCWLVAAIASLTQDKILFNNVMPNEKKQSFGKQYCGAFSFRFWHFGEWVEIVVDDRLPTHNGRLIFIHSTDQDEFWSALLEKAYAKLYGGYESLKGGKTSEAMEDFTGGVVESYDLKTGPSDLYDRILKGAKRSSLMSCSIKPDSRDDVEKKLDSGLVKGHAYSVTGAAKVTVGGKEVQLVCIRNPWGQKEWTGDWSDDSSTWNSISPDERRKLQGDGAKEDGEFWMSFQDMCKHYTDFEMCSVTIDQMYEDGNIKSWNSIVLNGSWLKSNGSAGGCRNFPSFTNNPQFKVDLLEDADGDGKCSVLVALMQKNRRKQKKMGVQELCIGFTIYKTPDGNTPLDKQYVDYHYSAGNSGSFTNAREVMKRFDLEPGQYSIIPCAFKPDEEGDFLLRIFSESASRQSKDAKVEPASGTDTGAAPRDIKQSKMYAFFQRLAGEDGEVDSEELQDILTASLCKDTKLTFSLDACRAMIAMLDDDKNGTLNFSEFQILLTTINDWKKMFFKFDRDRSGTLDKNEVERAIRSLGYEISSEAMRILFNRFAKKRSYMNIDDFSACLSRVKIMDDTFKRMAGHRDTIALTKDQFFRITLDA